MELLNHRKRGIVSGVRRVLAAHWVPWAIALVTGAEVLAAPPTDSPAAPEASKTPITAPPEPQLELMITGPQKATVGKEVTFELMVTNTGRKPATGLVVVDHFDPGLEHAVAASPIEHDLKDLRPGQSQRIGLVFRVTRSGKLSHRVELTQQGKTITAARSVVTAVGSEPGESSDKGPAAPAETAEGKPARSKPTEGTPDRAAKAKLSKPAEPAFDFPEVPPREETPAQQEKTPDLGPPLVDKPEELKRLHPKFPVWIDRKQNRVVLVGAVCARAVPLELFACLRGSKEHESVVAIPTRASFVHAALLAVGAEPGAPVQFRPKYVPAHGSEIDITCVWNDPQGKRQTVRAQDWVRDHKSGKALEYPWVFAGSRFRKDPDTGETYYQADGSGELICVSNFPGATLDLPIESTSSDADLLFECFTEHIPPRGTPVTLILTPRPQKPAEKPAPKAKQATAKPESAAPVAEKPAKAPAPPAADKTKGKT